MNWFRNLRISVKLLTSFIILAIIAGIVGVVGHYYITDIGHNILPSVKYLLEIEEDFAEVSARDNLMLSPDVPYDLRLSNYDGLDEVMKKIKANGASFQSLTQSAKVKALWEEADGALQQWIGGHEQFIELSKQYDSIGIDNPSALKYELTLREKDHIEWIWLLLEDINNERVFSGELNPKQCNLGKWLETYDTRSEEIKTLMAELVEPHDAVHESGHQINTILQSDAKNKREAALEAYYSVTIPQMNKVLDIMGQMETVADQSDGVLKQMTSQMINDNTAYYFDAMEKIEKLMEQVNDETNKAIANAVFMIIILTLAAIILSVVFGLFISSMIKKPISKLVKAADIIAEGNLDVTIDIHSKDEIGILADAFAKMKNNVNRTLMNINSASEQVASGSAQVSDSSMSLSQGATEQASSIEEVTTSIEEIATQTKQNAQNADKAKAIALNTQSYAQQGNEQMEQMLQAMVEINNASKNISKIIKVIDDIAFQTNILALNAAVEAARAGQHGKGFAVVAEEVRNLAARSANAAKETTTMIEGSISKVDVGTKIANETSQALRKIVEGVSQAAELVGEIALASNEQAIGVEQINQAVTQISDVVQTTSATAEETAAASEQLSSQAGLLKSQVAAFELKQGEHYVDNNQERINPQVLKMLEEMQNNKENKDMDSQEPNEISLSDSEFEKY